MRVLLTGESADELLGGYGRFRQYRYLPWLRLAATVMRPVRGRLRREKQAKDMKPPAGLPNTLP